jgi:hypothetical protein
MFAMEEAEGRLRPRRLIDSSFLWQSPDDEECVPWEAGLLDLNGDGLEDCVIPEDGAYRIGIQSLDENGESQFTATLIRLPISLLDLSGSPRESKRAASKQRGRGLVFRAGIDLGGDDPELLGPLLSLVEAVATPTFADWDGDGDLDLLTRNRLELLVYLQTAPSVFSPTPLARYPLPVRLDAARQFDVSYSMQIADLNHDRRADAVFVAGQQQSEDVRAQVLVYQQGFTAERSRATTPEAPLFGPRGLPAQLIPLAGFVGATELVDVDGDGYLDLSLASFRPESLDALKGSSKTLDLGWFVFRNRGGTFSQLADLQAEVRLSLSDLDDGMRYLSANWICDLNKDSLSELLVQRSSNRTILFASKRERTRWTLERDPVWTIQTDGSHDLIAPFGLRNRRLYALRSKGELVILEWQQ